MCQSDDETADGFEGSQFGKEGGLILRGEGVIVRLGGGAAGGGCLYIRGWVGPIWKRGCLEIGGAFTGGIKNNASGVGVGSWAAVEPALVYAFVCVCVCMCVRERERESESENESETKEGLRGPRGLPLFPCKKLGP